MIKIFRNKRILITGACGTVGSELIRQLLTNKNYEPTEVIGLDNNESGIFFQDQTYLNFKNARFFVADIKNTNELIRKFEGVDIVFHTAALKHVVLSERSPEQAVETNIIGVQNVIAAANINKVEKVIFTSSDKAVNPTNVMGTSKLMGERLMTAANSIKRSRGPIFASTRFGNVLGSSGSVVSIFRSQILNGGPLTLTDNSMTRFVMSIEDAVHLVIHSSLMAQGGEVFITKMPVVRIPDLAEAMIEILSERYGFDPKKIKLTKIGIKPGEKIYEELMNTEETRRTIELEHYFSVLPAFRGIYNNIKYNYKGIITRNIKSAYNSNEQVPINIKEIKSILKKNNLLEKNNQDIANRYWPGDKEQKN